MQELLLRLKEIANQNPHGFTVYLPGFEPVREGWIVAMKETQNSFGDEGLERAFTVALKTSTIIGGWKDKKKWYWDASQIFSEKAEAIKFAKEQEQIAIYNIENNEYVFLD